MPYLVDGNNLAHVLGLSKAGLADREATTQLVGRFCRFQGAHAVVVFDGPAPAGGPRSHQLHRMKVEFSESRPADELILKQLDASKTPKDFTVVTSDKSLGDKARHRGATVEKAHVFARKLSRVPSGEGAESGETAPKETPAQIEAWLAVFDPQRTERK
jgi:predicted RNA-binding protein with PIN domain